GLGQIASWVLRQDGRAIPTEPDELRRAVADGLRKIREVHSGDVPKVASESKRRKSDGSAERAAGPVAPERFAVLQALLAYLLAAPRVRLALELVGPGMAAEVHTPLERVRRKLEETFAEFELAQTSVPQDDTEAERLIATFTESIRQHLLVEVEYQKEGEKTWSQRVVEPYRLERALPHWYVHTWDRT